MTAVSSVEWCHVSSGAFLFGEEKQLRELQAFRISKYPVTYEEFQAFIDDPNGYANAWWWKGMPEEAHRQRKRGPRLQEFPDVRNPRENVSWYEAFAYCEWLSERIGYPVTLPTEEQWEKAARGSDGLVFPYGDHFDPSKCNACSSGNGQTVSVDRYPLGASPYGVMDMCANVREWTLSEYESGKSGDLGSTTRRVILPN